MKLFLSIYSHLPYSRCAYSQRLSTIEFDLIVDRTFLKTIGTHLRETKDQCRKEFSSQELARLFNVQLEMRLFVTACDEIYSTWVILIPAVSPTLHKPNTTGVYIVDFISFHALVTLHSGCAAACWWYHYTVSWHVWSHSPVCWTRGCLCLEEISLSKGR